MIVDFLQYNTNDWRPITNGGTQIETVSGFELYLEFICLMT